MKTGWTLFLDRDGVINELLPMDYVKTRNEFIFRKEVANELANLGNYFDYIFVITNQQGVGKGLMNADDLTDVHLFMSEKIEEAGGRIDKIYSCTHLKEVDCECRKPKPGMLHTAFREFPEADPKKSILVGDSSSDIEMAKGFGIISVGMTHIYNMHMEWQPEPDYKVNDLHELRLHVIPSILQVYNHPE
jgi:histidinol-phosphate phosphatase family protein